MKHIWKVGDRAYITNFDGKAIKDFVWEIDQIDERGLRVVIIPEECIGPRQDWDTSLLVPVAK